MGFETRTGQERGRHLWVGSLWPGADHPSGPHVVDNRCGRNCSGERGTCCGGGGVYCVGGDGEVHAK